MAESFPLVEASVAASSFPIEALTLALWHQHEQGQRCREPEVRAWIRVLGSDLSWNLN